MQLVKLTANVDSFHTVFFNEGFNLIVGAKSNPAGKRDGNTFNGVGKSLIGHLIHFCLCSNKIEALETSLPDWEFTLFVRHNHREHSLTRNTSKQNTIIVDGEKKTLTEAREILSGWGISQDAPDSISFSAILSKFVRRYRSCYTSYYCSSSYDDPYVNLLTNAYLLGMDTQLIVTKKKLRDEQDNLKKTEKLFKKDPIFREYYCGKGDVQIDIDELEYSILKLEQELSDFKISSNYHELESRANSLSFTKKEKENQRALIESNIKNIRAALDIQASISVESVIKLYSDAEIEISGMIRKTLDEVEAFHQNLISKRKTRLTSELRFHELQLADITSEISVIGSEMDQLLAYLNTHGALDEYTALNKQLTDLKLRLSHIKEYQNMLKAFQERLNNIKDEYIIENRKADQYLNDIDDQLKGLRLTFRQMAKLFYPNKKSGLVIENNTNENKLRYNIDARIEDDSSDGVNEVRIFCFDLLMQLQHISLLDFIVHDSRLLANMDPRQRTTLFRIAYDACKEHNVQYIATINEDVLQSISEIMDTEEYNSIVVPNIVLRLKDDSPSSKLLGVQVDISLEH